MRHSEVVNVGYKETKSLVFAATLAHKDKMESQLYDEKND